VEDCQVSLGFGPQLARQLRAKINKTIKQVKKALNIQNLSLQLFRVFKL